MLIQEKLDIRKEYGETWYKLYSDIEYRGVKQISTGTIYGSVITIDTFLYDYEEADLPASMMNQGE